MSAYPWLPLLPDSARIEAGDLSLDGCSIGSLADRYGTPLYVYDEATLRNQARRVISSFAPLKARISFACKACSTLGVLRVLCQEGLELDAVSGGEIDAGLRAGFNAGQIHLHGNFKTATELETAVRLQIRAIVVDNNAEIEELEAICEHLDMTARVMLRIALPLEPETHPHLRTSGRRAKFGFFHSSRDEASALCALALSRRLRLTGIHVHLGSQITDAGIYQRAAREIIRFAESLREHHAALDEASLGGGWAVAYRPEESTLAPAALATSLAPVFGASPWCRPAVEPGRALVARAGVAVYRVGSIKTADTARIISVDGGIGDNPRPALYGARYTALKVAGIDDAPQGPADIVGRYCESGDVLALDVVLPPVTAGDLICIPVSGAYQLPMSSSYNLVPQPAVALVNGGEARLLTRRATVDDLLQREINTPVGSKERC